MASWYVLTALLLWSSLGVVVRLSGVSEHILIFYSMVISVTSQGILLAQKKYRKSIPGLKELKYPAILGFFSLLNVFTFFYAFKHTTIANAVLTHYTAPVIVAFLAPLFLGEVITVKIILVIGIASSGLWIMTDGFSFQEGHIAGIMAGLASGLAYAIIIIIVRICAQRFHPLILAFFTNSSIVILLLPFVRELPLADLWSFLIIGIVHSTIAPILYYKGLEKVTASRAAVLGYIEPASAILLSVIFLKETVALRTIIGGFLVLLSGYLVARNRRNSRR
ncbi:MAG: DMT family transporter [Nitrospirota bacterium]